MVWLCGNLGEEYVFGVCLAVGAFSFFGLVDCFAVWAFDSDHVVEVFVDDFHFLFF